MVQTRNNSDFVAVQLAEIATKLDAIVSQMRKDVEELKTVMFGKPTTNQATPPEELPTPPPPKLVTPPQSLPKLPGPPPPKQLSSITETTDIATTTTETTHFAYNNNHLNTEKNILATTLAKEISFSVFPPKSSLFVFPPKIKEQKLMMCVDANETDCLPQHEKEHKRVSVPSKSTNLGKQKSMNNWKEFLHVRNKDVQADLKRRDLAGQFSSSRLEDKSFHQVGCIDTNPELLGQNYCWIEVNGLEGKYSKIQEVWMIQKLREVGHNC